MEPPKRNAIVGFLDKLVPIFILAVFWSFVAWFITGIRGVEFPGPLETVLYLITIAQGKVIFQSTLYVHLLHSFKRFILGFGMASVVGVTAGLLMGYSKMLRERLYPLVSILQPMPSTAWIPISILVFGIGDLSTVFIIFLSSLWPTVVNTVAGAESVPDNYLRLAQMFKMRKAKVFTRIVMPHSVPHILTGLRTAVANSWRSLVAAEMIAATGTGLGYVIIQSRWNLDYKTALACIVVIAIIGYLMEKVVFRYIESMTLKKWGMQTT